MKRSMMLIAIFSCLPLFQCAQRAQWDGTFKIIDGITHAINNGRPLLAKPQPIIAEERFTIGQDVGRRYMLSAPVDLVCDSTGNIYIIDARENSLLKFSRDGAFLQAIIREGQGPGELSCPSRIDLKGEHLYIREAGNQRFSVFDLNLQYLDIFKAGLGQNIESFVMTPDESSIILASNGPQSTDVKQAFDLFQYSTQGTPLRQFGPRIPLGDLGIFGHQYATPLLVLWKEQIACGHASPYQIDIYDTAGKRIRQITKNDGQVNKLKKCAIPPVSFMFLPQVRATALYTNQNDYLIVKLEDQGDDYQERYNQAQSPQEMPKSTESTCYYDFFDNQGRFLFQYHPSEDMGQILYFDTQGHFYTRRYGEEGVFITKYRYRIDR